MTKSNAIKKCDKNELEFAEDEGGSRGVGAGGVVAVESGESTGPGGF